MSEMRWIPVEVRLPKLYETVIVTTSANAVMTAFMNADQKWRYLEDDELYVEDVVTAWMPLPEPYKEGSDDDHMIAISSSLWKSLRAAADYQIPKAPEKVCSGYADGHPVYDVFCPKCGNELDCVDKVCDECGQRIDWSDGKEE